MTRTSRRTCRNSTAQYGLQAPPSFTQYVENGLLPTDSGWSLETALDVEWAHAMAPAANIVLVEAQPTLNDLFSAVSFASQSAGRVGRLDELGSRRVRRRIGL